MTKGHQTTQSKSNFSYCEICSSSLVCAKLFGVICLAVCVRCASHTTKKTTEGHSTTHEPKVLLSRMPQSFYRLWLCVAPAMCFVFWSKVKDCWCGINRVSVRSREYPFEDVACLWNLLHSKVFGRFMGHSVYAFGGPTAKTFKQRH